MQNHKTVCKNNTYESYILRRVKKSLNKLPLQGKILFAKDFQKWVDNNGEKYTVDRLKAIKQVVIHSYNTYHTQGIIPTINQSDAKSYLATDASGKFLAGYLGNMQYMSLHSDKVFEQFLQLIHSYTLIIDEGVTKEDINNLLEIIEPRPEAEKQDYIDKFCNSIQGLRVQKYLNETMVSYLDTVRVTYKPYLTYPEITIPSNRNYLLKEPIGFPKTYSLCQPYEAHENEFFFSNFVTFNGSKLAYDIYQIMPELWDYLPKVEPPRYTNAIQPVGQMNLINEGGLKKRWVENTGYIIQWMTHPFGKRLYDIIKCLPWDCTFNEYKGIATIQVALQNGKTCHSVDMSKATDKIPMDYNVAMLKKVFKRIPDMSRHVDVFNLIARANVLLPEVKHDDGSIDTSIPVYTRWGTGQPMGAYPSFAMLTLVHGLILFVLNDYKYNDDFVVHGDDVVILNDSLANNYKQFLKNSGIDYSEAKTITGKRFAEINSKIVLAHKVLEPVKWKEMNINNILDTARYWSPDLAKSICGNVHKVAKKTTMKNGKRIVTRKKYRVTTPQMVEDILSLPYPLGANLNPKGLSLETRLNKFPGLIDSLVEQSLTPEDNVYYMSYRDLVLERYSKYATAYNSKTECREIDSNFFQALLSDLEVADKADRLSVLSTYAHRRVSKDMGLHMMWALRNTNYYDLVGHYNVLFMASSETPILDRPSPINEQSSNKKRKKETKSRFQNVQKFYCAPVKCSSV